MNHTLTKEKEIIAKLFGLHSHIVALERQIHDLSWDKAFDMWTRNAFIQFCRVMPRGTRIVAFIDIDNVHGLNRELGYMEVDRRIRNAFSIPWRSGDVIARWYSGDEIVILFDSDMPGAMIKMDELRRSAELNGLGFAEEIGTWEVGKRSIESVAGDLSELLRQNNPGTQR